MTLFRINLWLKMEFCPCSKNFQIAISDDNVAVRRRPPTPHDAARGQILTGFFSAFSSNLKLLSSISRSWDISKRVVPPYFRIKRWFLQSHAQSAWSHETSDLDLENQQNLSFQAISSFCLWVYYKILRNWTELGCYASVSAAKLHFGCPTLRLNNSSSRHARKKL